MFPQYPLRFGTLSSLRGTGLRVGGAAAHVRVIQLEVPPAFIPAPLGIKTPSPRFPVCYGRVSSVRGSGISVSVDPVSAGIVLMEAPHRVPAPRFPIRFGCMGATQGRGISFRADPVVASFDRAEYDVTREIAFRAVKAFAQLYAEAYPDVSGGVSVMFEEVYPV